MGVPKFFRYISERYPCLSELAREQSIPEFDNLYLDMNGIIHKCSHPDDNNVHFNITEEDMIKDIFNYIEKLFYLIKPRKLFFMAIDGVAPRAKMNQQRSRRFRSAKDSETLAQAAINRGEKLPDERFDSNCITPGTEFMFRLHQALQYFIKKKISTDPLWQQCSVILSGQDCPGEGEHKIMDYIRYMKSQENYDPNTRHCLYGLDADLIILGMCTHELHFVVLREEVKFGRKAKHTSVEATRFFLLHLGLLREYLEMDFCDLRKHDPTFDIAKLIDDWVLMGFLVGNDFIPHLPCMHISSNALTHLYKTYIEVYPKLGGNINESGKLNLERLEIYFAALSDVEFELFKENYVNLTYFVKKKTKNGIDEAFDFDANNMNTSNIDDDLAELIENSRQFLENGDDEFDESDESQQIQSEFLTYKRNYYIEKLKQDDMTTATTHEQAICYITALQWILDYYYHGVQSWDWYYPHHYAPFISDLKNFKNHEIKFNLGKPFLPFEQLLAVLPAASKQLLPPAYRDLMTSANSTLIDFYPIDFQTDLNGKQHDWEAVVLIPFIDEKLLLQAVKACNSQLTSSEVQRNRHGPMLKYVYSSKSQGGCTGVYSLKPLNTIFCCEKPIWYTDIAVSTDKTVCAELPNAARTVFFPGFPTMKHLSYDFELKFGHVKVFEYGSRNKNFILMPKIQIGYDDIFNVAEKFLNQVVYIGWPHLIKAKVVAVSNRDKYIDSDGIKDNDLKMFNLQVLGIKEHLMTRMGIEFPDFTVMVHVRVYKGSSYECENTGEVTLHDTWNSTVTVYPAQGVVSEIIAHNSIHNQYKKVEELFSTGSTVFFLGSPYYGSQGTVLDPMLVYMCGRLKVNILVISEPDFTQARYIQSQLERTYITTHQTATIVGISIKTLNRITGSVLVIPGLKTTTIPDNVQKINIGLQLRYPKQQEERVGYARRINNQWYYSMKAVTLIQNYSEKFPMVFRYLSTSFERIEFCFESDLFPENAGGNGIIEILEWIKQQDHANVDKIACGSKVMEKEVVEKVIDTIEYLRTLPVKRVKLQVKPHLLLKPNVTVPLKYKAKKPLKLFDRVVIVQTTYMVPIGSIGTVVGIYPVSDPNPVRVECVKSVENFLEVLFDIPLANGSDIHGIAENRVYNVPESAVLLIFNEDNVKQNEVVKSSMPECVYTGKRIPNIASENKDAHSNRKDKISTSNGTLPFVNVLQSNKANPTQGASDFWTPSANTKVKHTDASPQSTEKTNNTENFAHNIVKTIKSNCIPATDTIEPSIIESSTEALRSLLGITSHIEQFNNFVQPPRPPLSWYYNTTDNTNLSGHRMETAAFNSLGNMCLIQQRSNADGLNKLPELLSSEMPGSSRYFTSTTCEQGGLPTNPQNPHNHFNPGSLTHKGAFIPLQAMRTNNKTKGHSTNQIDSVQQNLQKFNLNYPSVIGNNDNLNCDGNTYKPSQENISKVKEDNHKTARTPKIGAKFDFKY